MRLKKIAAAVLSLSLVCGAVPFSNVFVNDSAVYATEESTESTYGMLTYCNYGNYIEITDCDSSATEVEIPCEIDGVAVTSIGDSAFYYCKSLTSVTIPDSVISIGDEVFSQCTSLTSIIIPDSVSDIGTADFYGCIALESVKLSPNITSLLKRPYGGGFFQGCTSLKEIDIPEGIKEIGYSCFYGCESLEKIIIPKSVEKFGGGAFMGTPWLIAKQKENPLVIVNETIIDATKCSGKVTIPEGVKAIAGCAEFGDDVSDILFPASLTYIDGYPFNDLFLENQPDGILYCGKVAHDYIGTMPENTQITFKEGTTQIPDFAYQTNLKEIYIPDSVVHIPEACFAGCSSLESVRLSPNIKSLSERDGEGGSATGFFAACTSLKEIVIPEGIEEIGFFCFGNCTALEKVSLPKTLKEVRNSAFENTPWLAKKQSENPLVIENSVLIDAHYCTGDVVVPDDVYLIAERAFGDIMYDNKFVTSIIMSDSVKYIGDCAFGYCSELKKVVLSDGLVSSIYNYVTVSGVRYFNSGVEKIYIPTGVSEIDCLEISNLTDLYYGGTEEQWNQMKLLHTSENYLNNITIHYNAKAILVANDTFLGDIDDDNTVNSSDASNVLAEYAKIATGSETTFSEIQTAAADVNNDGAVDSSDASSILAYYAYTATGGKDTLEEFLG